MRCVTAWCCILRRVVKTAIITGAANATGCNADANLWSATPSSDNVPAYLPDATRRTGRRHVHHYSLDKTYVLKCNHYWNDTTTIWSRQVGSRNLTNDACSFVRRPSYWSSTVVESHCAAQTTSSVSHVQPCRRRVRSLLCRQSGEIRQATSITPPAVIEMRYIAPFNNFPSANVKEIVDPLAVGRHYFFDGGWWKVIRHWLCLAVVPSN